MLRPVKHYRRRRNAWFFLNRGQKLVSWAGCWIRTDYHLNDDLMEKELKEFQKEWESNENTWVWVAQNLPCTIHKVLIVGMNRKPTSDLSASIKVERSFVFLEFCLKILEQYQSWRYWDIFSSNSFAFKARKVRTFNYPSIYWPPPMFKSNKRNSINLSWSFLSLRMSQI